MTRIGGAAQYARSIRIATQAAPRVSVIDRPAEDAEKRSNRRAPKNGRGHGARHEADFDPGGTPFPRCTVAPCPRRRSKEVRSLGERTMSEIAGAAGAA